MLVSHMIYNLYDQEGYCHNHNIYLLILLLFIICYILHVTGRCFNKASVGFVDVSYVTFFLPTASVSYVSAVNCHVHSRLML